MFQRLFGDGGSVEARLAQMQTDRSILDSVTESIGRIERRLGLRDRTAVEEYLDAVREIERRIQRAEASNASTPLPPVEQPAGVPEEYDDHVTLLFDLLVLAYQADVTRVSCTQMARELSGRTYPNIGVPEAASQRLAPPARAPQHRAIHQDQHAPHVAFARLIEKMHKTPDGDGTLLDHAIMLYGTGMGDGDHHTPYNLPVTLVGGGCGQLAGGRHMKYELNTPFMNLGVTLLDKVGVHVDRVSDSTGRLADL